MLCWNVMGPKKQNKGWSLRLLSELKRQISIAFKKQSFNRCQMEWFKAWERVGALSGELRILRSCRWDCGIWDSRVLQLNDVKEGSFSISHQLKSCENHFYWCFTSMYGSTIDKEREGLWNELRVVNGLVGGWWLQHIHIYRGKE